jgi:triphosphoribosyl-dephospho-CoA synthase
MAKLDDTCVLYRSGLEGREVIKADAKAVLTASGPGSQEGDAALRRFDRKLLEKRISPGGSANLLAASLFLDCLESGREVVQPDQSVEEETWRRLSSTIQRQSAASHPAKPEIERR